MHSKSLRGHRDCFEKCHLIANQKLSHSKVSQSAYEGIKLALSQKLSRIVQYAQNKDSVSSCGPSRRGAKLLCYSEQSNCKRFGQPDAQVPRYAPCRDTVKATGLPDYAIGMLECHAAEELGLLQESECDVWSRDSRKSLQFQNLSSRGATPKHRHQGHSRDDCRHFFVHFSVWSMWNWCQNGFLLFLFHLLVIFLSTEMSYFSGFISLVMLSRSSVSVRITALKNLKNILTIAQGFIC